MEFIKEYGASDSEDDKPVTPHTSEQYKASVNVRPESPHKATSTYMTWNFDTESPESPESPPPVQLRQSFLEGVPEYVPRRIQAVSPLPRLLDEHPDTVSEDQDADTVILDPHENMDVDDLEDKAESL